MSALSAGKAIYSLLSADETLKRMTKKMFPVVADNAPLPYIAFRRVSLTSVPQKQGMGADTVHMEVNVFTEEYEEGIEIAENVREVLECYGSREVADMLLRGCYLEASEETWGDDAYVQRLVFCVKIQ